MRGHSKSRHGCKQCKTRKVKCDETLPCCHRCSRRNQRCSYLEDHSTSLPSSNQHNKSTTSTYFPENRSSDQVQQAPLATSSAPYLKDIELVHLFLTETYKTLWGRTTGQILWREAIFEEALNYPALLDGILATAALHKVRLSPSNEVRFKSIALQKQRKALEGLIQLLHSLNAESCKVILPLSMLVSVWAFASRSLPDELGILHILDLTGSAIPSEPPHAVRSTLDQFIELVRRIQPVQLVVKEGWPWILGGRYSEFTRTPNERDLPELSEEVSMAIAELEFNLQETENLPPGLIELESRNSIRFMFRVSRCPEWAERILGWPMALSPSFLQHLQSRDPTALTLVGYWAVCLNALRHRWWMHGWQEALLDDVSACVEGRWAKLLEWPKLYLGGNT